MGMIGYGVAVGDWVVTECCRAPSRGVVLPDGGRWCGVDWW